MGWAASTGSHPKFASLPKFSSIFIAETHAIHLALNTASATKGKKFAIFTDSRSCLQALQKQIPTTQKVRKLKHNIANLRKIGKTVELCQIPGHAGIPGTEIADTKAKASSRRQEEIIACPYQDLFPYDNDAIHQKWNAEWNEKNEKLREIKPDNRPWKENDICRKDETVINRLRSGLTLLNHGYLMEGKPVPTESELSHNHTMTVKHLLAECDNLASLRLRFFDGSITNTLKKVLGRN